MANIRNQCTWVHQGVPEAATGKCQDLIRMAVAKARLLQPLDYLAVPINKTALVVGGGVAGLTSALGLADQGFKVHLVERTKRLGGNARKLHTTWRGGLVGPRLESLIQRVTSHPNISLHFDTLVEGVTGVVGNFASTLSNTDVIHHGIVVLAIGGEPYRPVGEYLYKKNPKVLLSLDLDMAIMGESEQLHQAQAVAFIQCVGSRIPERPYCNKVCCAHSVENAIKLKVMNPQREVYILYRDMRTYGERELYQRAREKRRGLHPVPPSRPPLVEEVDGRLKITVKDQVLERPVSFMVDLLTLATAIIPHHNAPTGGTSTQVPLNAEGSFTEAHAKIKPVEASTDGIYMAGLCHYPKPMQESVAEAMACASRATTVLSSILADGVHHLDPHRRELRRLRLLCGHLPLPGHHAAGIHERGRHQEDGGSQSHPVQGLRFLHGHLPETGIYVNGFTPEQLYAQVNAALGVI